MDKFAILLVRLFFCFWFGVDSIKCSKILNSSSLVSLSLDIESLLQRLRTEDDSLFNVNLLANVDEFLCVKERVIILSDENRGWLLLCLFLSLGIRLIGLKKSDCSTCNFHLEYLSNKYWK